MNLNDIQVNEPQVITTKSKSMKTIDLTQLSETELLAALAAKKKSKEENRAAYKDLVTETVPTALFKLCHVAEILSVAKRDTFKYFENIINLKKEVYGLKEKQRSHTFSTGSAEITIGYRINDGWDDTVTAGIEKVNKYIASLSKNAETAALVNMVFGLLRKDAKGNLKSSRVLELQKLTNEIDNEEFRDGVDIISKAYKPVRSSWYIDAYVVHDDRSKVSIPLSMSSVDFPEGYEFDFLKD
ncbi:DUF3164 family protein [Flavobacterium sp. '19STA2R22 D10 B1']|uniref:DUF3164 family protein n=1 Tax=Flavobacterium aerium TaxID=3037261 RepID=UPI00278BF80D|nr:DUF3164 family protein [Flavobacterium sp. '19STA2R22 D10 B1']